jgi:tetratricopeptide (TPR) repeat protein
VAARSQAGRIRDLVDQGLSAGSPDEMLRCFEAAHRLDLNDATAMSVHGMAIAMVQHRYQQGIVFCEEAVRRSGPSPFLLVNLAKAYLAARNRREAVRALRRALARSGGTDERARAELAALGLRRNPPIPFLPRSFFLNRWLGRLRHSLLERRAREDGAQPLPAELGRLSGDLSAATEAFEQSRTRESDAK